MVVNHGGLAMRQDQKEKVFPVQTPYILHGALMGSGSLWRGLSGICAELWEEVTGSLCLDVVLDRQSGMAYLGSCLNGNRGIKGKGTSQLTMNAENFEGLKATLSLPEEPF